MHANCSTSFSPGKRGYPVYSSARMQPKLHMSIGMLYGRPGNWNWFKSELLGTYFIEPFASNTLLRTSKFIFVSQSDCGISISAQRRIE